MINWFNMPAEGLSNGGQFEIKELTATENRTYEKDGEVYNKVTVNVSGGGSSDFSTAEVTLICSGVDGAVVTFYPISYREVESSLDYDYKSSCVITENGITTDMPSDGITVSVGTPQTIKFYMLNDSNFVIQGAELDTEFTVTGDAEAKTIDYGDSTTGTGVVVTGNCTISAVGTIK